VVVKNTGNVSIENFTFDVEMPGEHKGYLADVLADHGELRKAISITTDQPPPTLNPTFHVKVAGFLNPRESFKMAIFFDEEAVDCKVRCRVADVKAKVKSGEHVGIRDIWRGLSVEAVGGLGVALFGLMALVSYAGRIFSELIAILAVK
jgi:hypothetical protein